MFSKVLRISVLSILISAGSLIAATSTFDLGSDGWGGDASWSSTGGNPGGYLHFQDADGSSSWVMAPVEFLGDWSSLDGVGELNYDHKIISAGYYVNKYIPYHVNIYSGNDWAYWEGDTATGVTGWVDIEVPIDSSQWVVANGSWTDILSNVTGLQIRIEHVDNSDHQNNIEGIDNVNLVPEPASLSLLAIGGLLLKKARRKNCN